MSIIPIRIVVECLGDDGPMLAGNIYYCWSCDAHRRAEPSSERAACCPACGTALTEESRLVKKSPEPPIASYILSLPTAAAVAPRPRRALSA